MQQSKAIIFARVSSNAQRDEGYSLDSQLKLLRGFCKSNKLEIVKEYKIAETASKQERRKIFSELISYITKNKINHFVVEKTDRLTRNMKDASRLNDWMDGNEQRRLHIVKEGLQLHKNARSDEKFMWNIYLSFAKKYTDNLREEAMKGWAEKLAQGWLPSPPPPGYMTITQNNRKIHVVNPETAKLMERVFHFSLLPDSSVATTTEEMANMGITTRTGRRFAKSSVHKILTNPFYIGINHFNGKDYPGAQEPLISDELFYAVQRKLHRGRSSKVRKHNPIFKGLLKCSVCKHMVSWQLQKDRYYGACYRRANLCKGNGLLREDRVEAQIIAALENISDKTGDILKNLNIALDTDCTFITDDYRSKMVESLTKQLLRIEQMSKTLYEDRLTDYISKEMYETKNQQFVEQIKDIRSRIKDLTKKQNVQEKAVSLSNNPIVNLYLKSSPGRKRIIMTYIFEDMTVTNGTIHIGLGIYS